MGIILGVLLFTTAVVFLVGTLGVVLRLGREVVFFESLFKASKWTWLFGWVFHAGLFFVLLAHLRYGLLLRRILVDRVRYISAPSDYLMLLFIMAIAGSGLAMRYGFHANIVQVKEFALSLRSLSFGTLSFNPVLALHLVLVALLMLIFPFSKLLHAPALFFSPSRNQVDNPRERRHIAKWASALDNRRSEKTRG